MEKGIVVKPKIPTTFDVPVSPESNRILRVAVEEIEVFGHRLVDIDHLLFGMVREENGKAGQILRSAGLNVVAMRERMRSDEAAPDK